jgi:Holliday junction resolvase
MDAEELDTIINDIHLSWEKKEEAFDEEVKRQTGPRKWEALTPTERLQRKLDWYWGKPRKTNWQIGRDYERYIGYLYEQNGWNVYYHGKKGYEDLGRDLVCKKGKSVEIIQCKYWSKERTIHEKHVYYLYGTTVEYFLETFGDEANLKQLPLFPDLVRMRNVVPKLVVTTEVSPKATQVAKVLGIIIETIPFQRYPSVKCNVSRKNGEKIFHLPFDQQYDTILIEEERLERYVEAVNEAESLGFRHAYRWKGETPE